jgi:hypothetical protein
VLYPLSISFGATSLADSLELALTAIGGRARLGRSSYFDSYGTRNGEIALNLVDEALFVPDAGTVLCVSSTIEHELANVMPPGKGLSSWRGMSDHRSRLQDRVVSMLRSGKALYLAIGVDEPPAVNDEILRAGRIMQESADYTVAAAWRLALTVPFEIAVNEILPKAYPDLRWIEKVFRTATLTSRDDR